MESTTGPARESFFVNVSPKIQGYYPTFCFDSLDLATTRRTSELLRTWAKPSQVSTQWITKSQVKIIFIQTLSRNWGKISKLQCKCLVKIRRKKISCKQVNRKNRTLKTVCSCLHQTFGAPKTKAEALTCPKTTSVKSRRKHPTQR